MSTRSTGPADSLNVRIDDPAKFARIDEFHSFGPNDELMVDRSAGTPSADSRLVHYDPSTESYMIVTPERIRFNTLNGVTVFQETSPWDTQNRQDPPVNFHAIVQPMSRGARAVRCPILYPRTETSDKHFARNVALFTPSGQAFAIRDIRLGASGLAAIRIVLRVALAGDELMFTLGATNLSREPLRVSLIGFFLPLLTRGFTFNAESPWLHEGSVVPGRGFFIRSGEEGLACAIRRTARGGRANGVESRDNVDSILYYGGMDRNAGFPDALRLGGALKRRATSGFVAPACAHTQDDKILRPGNQFGIDFSVRAFVKSSDARRWLDRALTEGEVEKKVRDSAKAAEKLIGRSKLTSPVKSVTAFATWTKQQVSGCARIKTRFRLFWNYLLGIRDKAQAAYAAVDFDPGTARSIILELSGQQFEDGRFPRQYSFDGTYDLRYFMDSGLWLPTMLIPHYLKCTGDFPVLLEHAGYKKLLDWNPAKRTGRVVDSLKSSTVLDHLIENVDHVIRNRDPATGLVNIRDGDWNDAIGLIQNSLMVHEQLYMALDHMVDLANHIPEKIARTGAGRKLKKRVAAYRRLMDDLYDSFIRCGIQQNGNGRLRIIHGYTFEGRTVGGFSDSDTVVTKSQLRAAFRGRPPRNLSRWVETFKDSEGETLYKLHKRWVDRSCRKFARLPGKIQKLFLVDRVSSTPLSHALLSGILRHGDRQMAATLEDAVTQDARRLGSKYGFKTFSVPFNRHSRELKIGRIGNLDGAENASPYIHAGMFLCQGLYRIGEEELAGEFLTQTLPINRSVHAGQNRSIHYMPNSWGIGRNNDGASMNDFHSNSAAIFSRILVENIVGLAVTYDGVNIQPVWSLPDIFRSGGGPQEIVYETSLRGRRIRIVHRWKNSVDRREILFRQGRSGAFFKWSDLSPRKLNTILVHDPLGM